LRNNSGKKDLPRVFEFATMRKLKIKPAGIAQLVEQRTENPRVRSSNLRPGIPKKFQKDYHCEIPIGCSFVLSNFPSMAASLHRVIIEVVSTIEIDVGCEMSA
jgi:hypothetical protein